MDETGRLSVSVDKLSHLHLYVGLDRVVVLAHDGGKEQGEQRHGCLSQFIPCVKCAPVQRVVLEDPVQDFLDLLEELVLAEACVDLVALLVLLDFDEQGEWGHYLPLSY